MVLGIALASALSAPATPALAVGTANPPRPDLVSAKWSSATNVLKTGDTAKVTFSLTLPAQKVEFQYQDDSLAELRSVVWEGSGTTGPFTAVATAAVDSTYYAGNQRLKSVIVSYLWEKPDGTTATMQTYFSRDTGTVYPRDGGGDSRIQNLDFTVDNPARPLKTLTNLSPPTVEVMETYDMSTVGAVDVVRDPGQWSEPVPKFYVEPFIGGWLQGGWTDDPGPVVAYGFPGKSLLVRYTTLKPGYRPVTLSTAQFTPAGAPVPKVTGNPWFGETLKASLDPSTVFGLPAGAKPTITFDWYNEAHERIGSGPTYTIQASDAGRSIRAVALIRHNGRLVGLIGAPTMDYAELNVSPAVSNPTPKRNFGGGSTNNLIARTSWGDLIQHYTISKYRHESQPFIGWGWGAFNLLITPGDFNGDSLPDVLARKSNGELWLYPGDGNGGWMTASVIGWGWQGMTELIAPGDFDGDKRMDILAKDASGKLILYPGNGRSGWLSPRQVGQGWNVFDKVFSPGDFDGDSHPDVLARDKNGQLHLYSSNGGSGWLGSRVIGTGWSSMKFIGSAGDSDFDGWNDLYAVDQRGDLLIYPFNSGSWKPRKNLSPGWGTYTALF
ncbi:MAG TPA: VCBS repeat-containing protein [Paenarthrobacter sp.]|nr:VCBS repeat-containing protein [Paenarthrobacter sp.]